MLALQQQRLCTQHAQQQPQMCLRACRSRRCAPLPIVAQHRQHVAGIVERAAVQGKHALLAAGSAALLLCSTAGSAQATDKVAEWTASGIFFKDSVEVVAQEDPKVQGVTIFISEFQRSITEKLSKDFFNEPSQASVTCALTGKLAFDEKDIEGKEGQEVFSERKGLNLLQQKTLRVRRVWDPAHKTLLYIAYSTHATNGHDDDAGRYKTSVCALPLAGNADAVPKF